LPAAATQIDGRDCSPARPEGLSPTPTTQNVADEKGGTVPRIPATQNTADEKSETHETDEADSNASEIVANVPVGPVVDDVDIAILRTLAKGAPKLLVDAEIEAESDVSRRTIQSRIKKLVESQREGTGSMAGNKSGSVEQMNVSGLFSVLFSSTWTASSVI
jgi:hypothetical protein